MADWTIQKLLNWITDYFTQKGVDSPRLSAEMLLGYVLNLKRIELYTNFDKPVDAADLARLREYVKRAAEHEPVAYLVGHTEFYSLEIDVSPAVLIPRPDTEVLVENAVGFLRQQGGRRFVCDLCTGSGCVAVAIAKNHPDCKIIATDVSSDALEIAAANVAKHGLEDRIELRQGHFFEPLLPYLDKQRFDLIVVNPPYVSDSEYAGLDRNVRDYEPSSALLAGQDGLDAYRQIIPQASEHLTDDGVLMLEIGYEQAEAVSKLLAETGDFSPPQVKKDTASRDRVVICRKETP